MASIARIKVVSEEIHLTLINGYFRVIVCFSFRFLLFYYCQLLPSLSYAINVDISTYLTSGLSCSMLVNGPVIVRLDIISQACVIKFYIPFSFSALYNMEIYIFQLAESNNLARLSKEIAEKSKQLRYGFVCALISYCNVHTEI